MAIERKIPGVKWILEDIVFQSWFRRSTASWLDPAAKWEQTKHNPVLKRENRMATASLFPILPITPIRWRMSEKAEKDEEKSAIKYRTERQ